MGCGCWPQALRLVLSPCGNAVIGMLKSKALASTVTMAEITGVAETFAPYEVFLSAAVIYPILIRNFERNLGAVERALEMPQAGREFPGNAARLCQNADKRDGDMAASRVLAVIDCSIRVVLAKAEYESWFLAAAASLAGHRGIDEAASPPPDSEAIRDAKGWLSARMPPGRRYRETLHQAALTARFDLDSARAAPSFDKMWRDLASLIGGPGLTSAGSRS